MLKKNRKGQVIVETLLILPVFFMIIFMIMEIGHLAFQTIVLHHAAFELARIGSLASAPRAGEGFNPRLDRANSLMGNTLRRIFPRQNASFKSRVDITLKDRQSGLSNRDVVVTIDYACPLVFPMTHLILDNRSGPIKKSMGGGRTRMLQAEVRMPIQMPSFK